MNIEKIRVEKLLPAKYNPRKDLQPGDSEFEKLKRSITEFGYVEPIIWIHSFPTRRSSEIGRASCRERVYCWCFHFCVRD